MSLSMLEVQRARRTLEEFCARRNRTQGGEMACRLDGNDLLVVEMGGSARAARPVLRLSYRDGSWQVLWARENGGWEPYVHLPFSDSIQRVVDELEQAPLHVHWG
jgi:hypothetical protein